MAVRVPAFVGHALFLGFMYGAIVQAVGAPDATYADLVQDKRTRYSRGRVAREVSSRARGGVVEMSYVNVLVRSLCCVAIVVALLSVVVFPRRPGPRQVVYPLSSPLPRTVLDYRHDDCVEFAALRQPVQWI